LFDIGQPQLHQPPPKMGWDTVHPRRRCPVSPKTDDVVDHRPLPAPAENIDTSSARLGCEPHARPATRFAQGASQAAIAAELGLAKSTVNFHARRLGVTGPARYVGRAFITRVLSYSGVRNSELCDLRIRDVRLHAPGGARFHIPDSKTEIGIRAVEMSPDLAEACVDHLERLKRSGGPTGPDDYLVPNARGGRISRQRVAEIVRDAAIEATGRRRTHRLPPLPTTTPHTLRRTYISIALSRTTSTSSG
jgi:hypothetical protein